MNVKNVKEKVYRSALQKSNNGLYKGGLNNEGNTVVKLISQLIKLDRLCGFRKMFVSLVWVNKLSQVSFLIVRVNFST